MAEEYDVIVVGAGPGGAIAAKVAAEKNLKTIFFERGRKPGEKNASGCGLGPRMWRDFDFMDQLTEDKCPSLRMARCVIIRYINDEGKEKATEAYHPTGSVTYEPAKTWITMNVYRSEFDPWLADMAVKAGAVLKTSTLVKELVKDGKGRVIGVKDEEGETYKGKVVIGADGALSMVARQSGLKAKWLPNEVTFLPQYDFQADPKRIDEFMGPDGFIQDGASGLWIGTNFPAAYQVTFGDGFHLGLASWMGQWKANPIHSINTVVKSEPFQRMLKYLDAKPREIQAHLLPWAASPVKTYTDNVMLIGDAGGFPCPLEGEGIYPAMLTGQLAAETAAEAIEKGDTSEAFLKLYEEKWRKSSVGVEFEHGDMLQMLWRNLWFDEETMKWFWSMRLEMRGGIYDWSEPHVVRIRQIISELVTYLPQALPWFMKNGMPLFADLMEENINTIANLAKMFKQFMPK